MASKYWIKLYHEILEDSKMGRLPDNVWRRCIELFLLAGELDQDGQLPSTTEIAWHLRQSQEKLEAELSHLEQVGIVESNDKGWFITKFAERQAPVTSTERSRYSRQKAKESATNRRIVSNILPRQWAYPLYKDLPNTPGIYRIFCSGSGLSYVGASRNVQQRIKQHLSEMTHSGHKMSDDLYIYGPESLTVDILEEALDESELPKLETKWLLKYMDTLYNTEKLGKNHRDRIATNRCTDTDTNKDKESIPNGIGGEPPPVGPKTKVKDRFIELTRLEMPTRKADKGFWWSQFGEILHLARGDPDLACKWQCEVIDYMGTSHLTITGPQSIIGMVRALASGQPLKSGATNGHSRTHQTGAARGTLKPRPMDETTIRDVESEIAELERRLEIRGNPTSASP